MKRMNRLDERSADIGAQSTMIAMYPPPDWLERAGLLSPSSPLDPDLMSAAHMTLLYVGDTTIGELSMIDRALSAAASRGGVLHKIGATPAHVNGVGVFLNGGTAVLHLVMNHHKLPQLRAALENIITDLGIELPSKHGFVPHMTLKYLDSSEQINLGAAMEAARQAQGCGSWGGSMVYLIQNDRVIGTYRLPE